MHPIRYWSKRKQRLINYKLKKKIEELRAIYAASTVVIILAALILLLWLILNK